MRKQFVATTESILEQDEGTILLLGDIGVWGFKNAFENFPDRVYNIGILEQSTISIASGLALTGFTPIVHTIASFLVERSYEQLKNDFGYQKLGGNFVSVGASYDYAALGCTHHCPADIGILKYIPGMEIVLPGTAKEFDILFRQSYSNGNPTYFRLSEYTNGIEREVTFGYANVVKKGKLATVVAVGTTLGLVLEAVKHMDVTVLYYTTVRPFDADTLKENCDSGRVLLCEPYYTGVLSSDIMNAMFPRSIVLDHIGVPLNFLSDYGKKEDHSIAIGLTVKNIREKVHNICMYE